MADPKFSLRWGADESMIESKQLWFTRDGKRLAGFLRKNSTNSYRWGAIFCHGICQNKAGSYFLFSRIAGSIAELIPTFQFNFYGFGDSEGETSEVTLDSLQLDVTAAVRELKKRTGCNHILFIGAGFGNCIAALAAKTEPQSALVLLSPYQTPLKDMPVWKNIQSYISGDIINTADIGDWKIENQVGLIFQMLGEGLNRSKGVLIISDFLKRMASFAPHQILTDYAGPVLEFYPAGNKALVESSSSVNVCLPKSDFKLLNPLDRELLINTTMKWVSDLITPDNEV